jgi:hypothetical protein
MAKLVILVNRFMMIGCFKNKESFYVWARCVLLTITRVALKVFFLQRHGMLPGRRLQWFYPEGPLLGSAGWHGHSGHGKHTLKASGWEWALLL